MKFFRHCFNTQTAVAVGALFLFQITGFSQKSSNVVVTNTSGNPVPVKRADNPAYQAYKIGVEWGETKSVPLGKTFVVEHISGHYQIGSAFAAAGPCRIMRLAIPVGSESIDVVPAYMGTAPGLTQDINFFSFSQQYKGYITQGSDVPGFATSSLTQYCNSFPVFYSRVVFSGYLVDVNQ